MTAGLVSGQTGARACHSPIFVDEEVKLEKLQGEPRFSNFGPVVITGRRQHGWALQSLRNASH